MISLLLTIIALLVASAARAFSIPLVLWLARCWVLFISAGVEPGERESRRDKALQFMKDAKDDLFSESEGRARSDIAWHLLVILLKSIPSDIAWRTRIAWRSSARLAFPLFLLIAVSLYQLFELSLTLGLFLTQVNVMMGYGPGYDAIKLLSHPLKAIWHNASFWLYSLDILIVLGPPVLLWENLRGIERIRKRLRIVRNAHVKS